MEKTYNNLTITDEGKVYNNTTNKEISIFYDPKGNSMFYEPNTGRCKRVDYYVSMLFLNDGIFIERMTDYFIKHKNRK